MANNEFPGTTREGVTSDHTFNYYKQLQQAFNGLGVGLFASSFTYSGTSYEATLRYAGSDGADTWTGTGPDLAVTTFTSHTDPDYAQTGSPYDAPANTGVLYKGQDGSGGNGHRASGDTTTGDLGGTSDFMLEIAFKTGTSVGTFEVLCAKRDVDSGFGWYLANNAGDLRLSIRGDSSQNPTFCSLAPSTNYIAWIFGDSSDNTSTGLRLFTSEDLATPSGSAVEFPSSAVNDISDTDGPFAIGIDSAGTTAANSYTFSGTIYFCQVWILAGGTWGGTATNESDWIKLVSDRNAELLSKVIPFSAAHPYKKLYTSIPYAVSGSG